MNKVIDAHIHLDQYKDEEIKEIIEGSPFLDFLISVSFDLASSKRNLFLSEKYSKVHPAFGFHPEQALPDERKLEALITWMDGHKEQMTAIGEVGLPYYLRKEQMDGSISLHSYIEVLEIFIKLAKKWDKPIVLHAVYEDAPIACDLLEKHSIKKAHFHWFKGSRNMVQRLIQNGYCISFTPDILYEQEIQEIAVTFPVSQVMAETDGPWPFEGPFQGMPTHPRMIHDSVKMISALKDIPLQKTYEQIYHNTKCFYSLDQY